MQKLVRQHAHTARLLGVDFVPTYRMSPVEAGDEASDKAGDKASDAASNAPATAQAHAAITTRPQAAQEFLQAAAPAIATPKPASGSSASPRNAKSASSTTLDWSPPPRGAGEDERAHRTRALLALQQKYIADAPHQHFVTAFTNIVFGDGDPCADICFVGEAPGEEEDKTGKPFVGRAGQLLGKMIVAMGLSRERVYICNILKTRPPNNATPTTKEIDICRPYLLAQLAIVKPKAIVTLGLPASRACLQTDDTMARLRGQWASMTLTSDASDKLTVPVMPTYHPAFLLRSYTEDNRRKVWSDLCMVLSKVGLPVPKQASTAKANAESRAPESQDPESQDPESREQA